MFSRLSGVFSCELRPQQSHEADKQHNLQATETGFVFFLFPFFFSFDASVPYFLYFFLFFHFIFIYSLYILLSAPPPSHPLQQSFFPSLSSEGGGLP